MALSNECVFPLHNLYLVEYFLDADDVDFVCFVIFLSRASLYLGSQDV